MADIKVGDSVLFYGKTLTVKSLEDGVAVVVDAAGHDGRDAARAKILELREAQKNLKGEAHDEIAKQIAELDGAASSAQFILKLRADLLTYWEERGVWASEGRILSDDQMAVFTKIMRRPLPDAHRTALAFLEAMPEAEFKKHLDEIKAKAVVA